MFRVIRASFNQRRKTLQNGLGNDASLPVTKEQAKEALEHTNGSVLDAIILLESEMKNENSFNDGMKVNNGAETVEEFKIWLKDLINKGNVSRIKISKDEKVLVDVPVNAGIAAGIIGIIIPPILAFVVVAAVVTQVTIEITKSDGTVEVVNKYITKTVNDVKEKAAGFTEKVKEKFEDMNVNTSSSSTHNNDIDLDENTFTYTVKFEDVDDKKE